MARAVRSVLSFLVLALAAGLVAAPSALAVQASGSILLVPSKQTQVAMGEEITVDVFFRNTSTQTPAINNESPPITETPATLTGPVVVDLGCIDCGCTTQDATAETFLGCDALGAGVTGCAPGVGPSVLINLPATGLVLPDDNPVFLARIRLRNNLDTTETRILRGSTGICALAACIQPPDFGCARCSAEGCTFIGAGQVEDILRCKHSCLSKVLFNSNLDTFIFQGVTIVNDPTFDPAAESFTLRLSRGGQELLLLSVPGGIPLSGNAWIFNGNGSQTVPGIDQIKITRQTGAGCQNSFRISVKAFGDLSALAGAGPETLKVEITYDSRPTFENEEPWTRTQSGDLQNDIDIVSQC